MPGVPEMAYLEAVCSYVHQFHGGGLWEYRYIFRETGHEAFEIVPTNERTTIVWRDDAPVPASSQRTMLTPLQAAQLKELFALTKQLHERESKVHIDVLSNPVLPEPMSPRLSWSTADIVVNYVTQEQLDANWLDRRQTSTNTLTLIQLGREEEAKAAALRATNGDARIEAAISECYRQKATHAIVQWDPSWLMESWLLVYAIVHPEPR